MYCPSCGAEGHEVTTLAEPTPSFIGTCGHVWVEDWSPWDQVPAPCLGPVQDVALPTADQLMEYALGIGSF